MCHTLFTQAARTFPYGSLCFYMETLEGIKGNVLILYLPSYVPAGLKGARVIADTSRLYGSMILCCVAFSSVARFFSPLENKEQNNVSSWLLCPAMSLSRWPIMLIFLGWGLGTLVFCRVTTDLQLYECQFSQRKWLHWRVGSMTLFYVEVFPFLKLPPSGSHPQISGGW